MGAHRRRDADVPEPGGAGGGHRRLGGAPAGAAARRAGRHRRRAGRGAHRAHPGTVAGEVRSALGRPLPAAQVPWMRIREVWLHAVDLDAGAEVADAPDGVLDLLLDEVTATLSATVGCPAVELVPTDRDRRFLLGADGGPATEVAPAESDRRFLLGDDGGPAVELAPTDHGLPGSDDAVAVVTAPAATLVGWLTGRMQAPPGAPELPRWL